MFAFESGTYILFFFHSDIDHRHFLVFFLGRWFGNIFSLNNNEKLHNNHFCCKKWVFTITQVFFQILITYITFVYTASHVQRSFTVVASDIRKKYWRNEIEISINFFIYGFIFGLFVKVALEKVLNVSHSFKYWILISDFSDFKFKEKDYYSLRVTILHKKKCKTQNVFSIFLN